VSAWLRHFPPPLEAEATLVAVPYAGGSAGVFGTWRRHLPTDLHLCAVQLPGRQDRLKEEPVTSLPEVVARLASEVLGAELTAPLVLLGHSMGAYLVAHLTRALTDLGRAPELTIVSGARLDDDAPRWSDVPDGRVLSLLEELGGIPPEVLAHPELVDIALVTLRADLALVDQRHDASLACRPFESPVLVIGGDDDPLVPTNTLRGWERVTTGSTAVIELPGGHFMPWDAPDAYHQCLRDQLTERGLCR
jgi:medium-chain acyl-[acyl-carrier-protein] hydrolase